MDRFLKFNKVYKDDGNFFQSGASSLVLNDGSKVFSNKVYLNKIFKESRYKSIKTVNDIYNIIGDPTGKLDKIKFDGVVVTDNADAFLYFKSEDNYNRVKNILDFIKDSYEYVLLGDTLDFVNFSLIVSNKNMKFLLLMDLKYEYVQLYKLSIDNEFDPQLLVDCYLDEGVDDTVLDFIDDDGYHITNSFTDISEVNVPMMTSILSAAGLIKWASRKGQWRLTNDYDDKNMMDSLVVILDTINSTQKRNYYSTAVMSFSELAELLYYIYNLIYSRCITGQDEIVINHGKLMNVITHIREYQ